MAKIATITFPYEFSEKAVNLICELVEWKEKSVKFVIHDFKNGFPKDYFFHMPRKALDELAERHFVVHHWFIVEGYLSFILRRYGQEITKRQVFQQPSVFPVTCPECEGYQLVMHPAYSEVPCPVCDGQGSIMEKI